MRRTVILSACYIATLLMSSSVAKADDLIEEYTAYIGNEDLYNSSHERLKQPWQIIRQDRANFHRFGISQRGDQNDHFFASAANRELVEQMISRGTIDRAAGRAIVGGNVMVNVRIFRGPRGDYVDVLVYN